MLSFWMTHNFKFCWPQNFDFCKRFSSVENLTYIFPRMRTRITNYSIDRINNSPAPRIVLTPLCLDSLSESASRPDTLVRTEPEEARNARLRLRPRETRAERVQRRRRGGPTRSRQQQVLSLDACDSPNNVRQTSLCLPASNIWNVPPCSDVESCSRR